MSQRVIFHQSYILAKASLKARYRNSVAGYLWVIMSPLLMFAAQGFVFKEIFRIQVENYFQFLLFGLSPWIFFSQTIDMSSGIFYNQSKLLKSFKLSPITLILAQAFDNLVNSLAVIVIALLLVSSVDQVYWDRIYLFPLAYFAIFISTVFLSALLSFFTVFFHDTRFFVQFLLSLLFFLTPIVYPESFVPDDFKIIIQLNPITYLVRPFRTLLESGPSQIFFFDLFISFSIALVSMIIFYLVWRKKNAEFYFKL